MKLKLVLTTCAALFALGASAEANDLVFSSWGGTTQDAQKAAWAEKFMVSTGINVVQDGPTDYGKLKAMVEANGVTWDVVDVEGDYAAQAGPKGLLEKLDFTVIDKTKLDPRFVTDYSVGSFYYSFVIGCNVDAVAACPKSWADLFDTAKFPGKRTFYKWSAPGVIEAALLADGVAADKLYPLDLDRAFKKLDTIKSDIIWWSGGAQSQQLIASAEAPFGSVWNGRMTALEKSGVFPRRSQGNEKQGCGDEVHRARHLCAGAGGYGDRDGLCAGQYRIRQADGSGNRQDPAGPADGKPGQRRYELLGAASRRDRRALVRLAGEVR